MTAVFLATDNQTLITRTVTHTHVIEHEDERGQVIYDTLFFFIGGGSSVLATSQWAVENIGRLVGVIEDHEDPEVLREHAYAFMVVTLKSGRES